MLTYKIKEGKVDENIKDTVIELHGFVPEFSIAKIETNIEVNQKYLKETEGNLEYINAKIANIEEHHPFVKHMEAQDLFTAHMYQESLNTKKKFVEFKEKLDTQIKRDEEEIQEIYKQIPELEAKVSADVVDGEVTLKEND